MKAVAMISSRWRTVSELDERRSANRGLKDYLSDPAPRAQSRIWLTEVGAKTCAVSGISGTKLAES
jgi:hypothetical protein